MDEKPSITAKCRSCGMNLPLSHAGPCPKCGETGKDIKVLIDEVISIIDSAGSINRLKKDKAIWIPNIFISILATIMGILAAISTMDWSKGRRAVLLTVISSITVFAVGAFIFLLARVSKVRRIAALKENETEFFEEIEDFMNSSLEGEK
ncbi:MAG: hypothetical protein A2026_04875 [Deltaproteobacteria bacterium RBG_19FT_COMBO_46_12]|nr:MAG: hypothetical protein A2026_04875 [Deltaproteobacteria bacterium RBG_19FT_COMBO_46_12]